MDEIDMLRGYRADAPGPSEGAIERARSRLLAAISEEAAAGSASEGRIAQAPRRRHRRTIMVLAGALVAGALVAAVALISASGPGETESAVAAVLHQAAAAAASHPAEHAPRPGQYVYTKSREASNSMRFETPARRSWSIRQHYTRQAWIGPNGSGRLREVAGRARFPTTTDRKLCLASGAGICRRKWLGSRPGRISSHTYGPGGLGYVNLRRLPTRPQPLLHFLRTRALGGPFRRLAAPRSNQEVFGEVEILLNETYAPPKLRSALYRLVILLPQIELVGPTRNSVGRRGVGVAQRYRGQREELIFDPKTGALIGTQLTVVNPAYPGMQSLHLPPRARIGSISYISSGVVGSTRALPGGGRVGSPEHRPAKRSATP